MIWDLIFSRKEPMLLTEEWIEASPTRHIHFQLGWIEYWKDGWVTHPKPELKAESKTFVSLYVAKKWMESL
jgi:hypothetical protein